MEIFNGCFECVEDIIGDFDIEASELDGVEILYAEYECPPYEGYAWVLFVKDGELYEVSGSHCSCMGLEGQWKPMRSNAKAILAYPNVSEEVKQMLRDRFNN